MNESLQTFARQDIIDGLKKCTDGQVEIFKRMYSFKHLDRTIEQVVAAMPEDKLDWAMRQVAGTIKKNEI